MHESATAVSVATVSSAKRHSARWVRKTRTAQSWWRAPPAEEDVAGSSAGAGVTPPLLPASAEVSSSNLDARESGLDGACAAKLATDARGPSSTAADDDGDVFYEARSEFTGSSASLASLANAVGDSSAHHREEDSAACLLDPYSPVAFARCAEAPLTPVRPPSAHFCLSKEVMVTRNSA